MYGTSNHAAIGSNSVAQGSNPRRLFCTHGRALPPPANGPAVCLVVGWVGVHWPVQNKFGSFYLPVVSTAWHSLSKPTQAAASRSADRWHSLSEEERT